MGDLVDVRACARYARVFASTSNSTQDFSNRRESSSCGNAELGNPARGDDDMKINHVSNEARLEGQVPVDPSNRIP